MGVRIIVICLQVALAARRAHDQARSKFQRAESLKANGTAQHKMCVCTINDETTLKDKDATIGQKCGSVPVVLAAQDCRTCKVGGVVHGYTVQAVLDEAAAPSITKNCQGKAGTCGIPAILMKGDATVTKKNAGSLKSDTTSSTEKGSVWAEITVGGKNLVIATSHGTEGIRCKGGVQVNGKPCDGNLQDGKANSGCKRGTTPSNGGKKYTDYEAEKQRVAHFETMVEKLKGLNPVIWGMDMNMRRVDARGCPIWGKTGATVVTDDNDFLGDNKKVGDVMTGYKWHPSPCPTYQKKAKGDEIKPCGKYDTGSTEKSKPVSFVDRIYSNIKTTDKVKVEEAFNVARDEDHDIVCVKVTLG